MANPVDIWIKQAEAAWLVKLNHYSKDLFSSTFLPSHDQTHHRRVWNICKALLKEIAGIPATVDRSLVEGLLIAAWFHDLGMVQSTREDHGSIGREICEAYFKNMNAALPVRFDEVLAAIEQHDMKSLKRSSVNGPGSSPGILEMLSIADDLEALGIIGIYRYTEIYLKRDKNLRTLGLRILGNVVIRYKNMAESCQYCPRLINSYREQYDQLISFFNGYNQQILVEPEADRVLYGHLGVVNQIRTLTEEGKHHPSGFLTKMAMKQGSDFVLKYFLALQDELEKARE